MSEVQQIDFLAVGSLGRANSPSVSGKDPLRLKLKPVPVASAVWWSRLHRPLTWWGRPGRRPGQRQPAYLAVSQRKARALCFALPTVCRTPGVVHGIHPHFRSKSRPRRRGTHRLPPELTSWCGAAEAGNCCRAVTPRLGAMQGRAGTSPGLSSRSRLPARPPAPLSGRWERPLPEGSHGIRPFPHSFHS